MISYTMIRKKILYTIYRYKLRNISFVCKKVESFILEVGNKSLKPLISSTIYQLRLLFQKISPNFLPFVI